MVTVNGEPAEGLAGLTVGEMLERRDCPRRMIAVERNGAIVPRAAWEAERVADGDVLEIVRFVGGG